VAIQDAMGWEDDHLHQFIFLHSPSGRRLNRDERFFIGVPFEERLEERGNTRPCWKENISSHLSLKRSIVIYEYDFGDMWIHVVKLEKILSLDESIKYPLCVDGKRACPPEDCGGVWGYENLLEVLARPQAQGSRRDAGMGRRSH